MGANDYTKYPIEEGAHVPGDPTDSLNRTQIKYYNPMKKKNQTQNYLEMNDIAVPILIKEDENGDIKFAMQYTYVPAKNRILLDLPTAGFREHKDEYSKEDMESVTKSLASSLGLEPVLENEDMKDFEMLTSKSDPVSQSFTNQTANIAKVKVKEVKKDRKLHWFSLNALDDLISGNYAMPIEAKYALLLLEEKYKDKLKNQKSIKADVNEKLLHMKFNQDKENLKEIYPHKYRFGIEEQLKLPKKVQKLLDEGLINVYGEGPRVYGKSKDSIQCIISRVVDGKVQIGLSKQQRSPFILREKINEYLQETSAGMIDPDDRIGARNKERTEKNAVRREARQETGIKVKLKHIMRKLSSPVLLGLGTEESTMIYLAELGEKYGFKKQKLDEQENIEKIEWFDLEALDIDSLHAPLPTKISLRLARRHYEKEKEKMLEQKDAR